VWRELRRESVGVAVRSGLFGARAGVFVRLLVLRCQWRSLRERGPRARAGCGNRWLPMCGEGRLRPEPDPQATLRRSGAQAPRRSGKQAVSGGCYEETRPRASLGLAWQPRARQSRRFRRRRRRRSGIGPKGNGEGQPLRPAARFDATPFGGPQRRASGEGHRRDLAFGWPDLPWESATTAQAKRIVGKRRAEGRASSEERSEACRGTAPCGAGAGTVGSRFGGTRSEGRWETAPARNPCTDDRFRLRFESYRPRKSSSDGDIVGAHVSARPGERSKRAALDCRHHQLAGGGAHEGAVVRRFRGDPGAARRACGALSALPTPHAMLSPGRWWQHHRFRCHVGTRLRSACGCAGDGWCRRPRRGRRAQLVIGERGSRSAGAGSRPSSVSVVVRSHAVPRRAWQHA